MVAVWEEALLQDALPSVGLCCLLAALVWMPGCHQHVLYCTQCRALVSGVGPSERLFCECPHRCVFKLNQKVKILK